MIDRFEETLHLLSMTLNLPLQTDRNNACALRVKHGVVIQLQRNAAQDRLLVGCKIVELPPGKFRENVLKEGLKANGLPDPRVGTFAYIAPVNTLFFFQEYSFDLLTNGERIASLLGPFIQTATDWKLAIERGNSAPTGTTSLPNPMDLRR